MVGRKRGWISTNVLCRHPKKELQSKGQKDVAELVDCEASTSSMELGVTASSSSEDKGTQTDFTSENIDQLESVVIIVQLKMRT